MSTLFTVETAELKHLYESEGLTLQEIADRFGASRQAVHSRFRRGNIKRRRRGNRPTENLPFESEVIHLYTNEKRTIRQIAHHFSCSKSPIYDCLKKHQLVRPRARRCPELEALQVGEAIIISRPPAKQFHVTIYYRAKAVGIRVGVKTIDSERISITRVK